MGRCGVSGENHTAGPWAVEQGVWPHLGYTVITARHAGMTARSPLAKLNNLIGEEESAPDARLIAAAPELLSAVRQYRSDMLHPDIADDSRKRRIEMIDRVIAKATSP